MQAYKFSAQYKNMIKNAYYKQLVSVSGAKRETRPAQYGYNISQWGIFPGVYSAGASTAYTNYNAIVEFDSNQ
jgi:hypothetical protein